MTLKELARDVVVKVDGNFDDALVEIRRRLSADRELYRAIVVPIVDAAIRQAVSTVADTIRRRPAPAAKGSARPAAPRADTVRGFQARAKQVRDSLMDYRLGGGVKLGDATKAQIAESATSLLLLGRETSVRGRWLALVASTLSENDTVCRTELTETHLQALQAQADRAVPKIAVPAETLFDEAPEVA